MPRYPNYSLSYRDTRGISRRVTVVVDVAFVACLYRLVEHSVADSHLSFLYSIKFDAAVLALDRKGAEELEAHVAALEVADSVLDVRHAFFQVSMRTSVL